MTRDVVIKNKKKEKLKTTMGIAMIVFAIAIFGAAYAYYQTVITGTASGVILEWDCLNQSGTLTSALGSLKPGSSGSFALKVKSTNFKTDVTVNLFYANSANVSPNFKIYKESGHTNVIPVSLFNPTSTTSGKYVRSDTGALTTSSNWRYSDYISVVGGKTYYFDENNTTTSVAGSAWYNESKTYISGFTKTELANAGNKMTAPADAKYLRHSFSTSTNPEWETKVLIYEGTTSQSPAFSKTSLAANTVQTFNAYYYWPLGTTAETPIATGTDSKELSIVYKITCKQVQ